MKGKPLLSLTLVYILVSVLASAVGQILLKKGMDDIGSLTLTLNQGVKLVWRMATQPYVVIGIIIYAFGTIFWLAALSRTDLSYAYPFASLQYAVMLGASWWLFNENVSLWRIAGTSIVILGVLLLSRS